jgi:hypothetical protein
MSAALPCYRYQPRHGPHHIIATSLGDSGKLDGDLPGLRQTVRGYGSNIDARVIVTDGSDKCFTLRVAGPIQPSPLDGPGGSELKRARGAGTR